MFDINKVDLLNSLLHLKNRGSYMTNYSNTLNALDSKKNLNSITSKNT